MTYVDKIFYFRAQKFPMSGRRQISPLVSSIQEMGRGGGTWNGMTIIKS
jgi:hypothetical protein